MANSDKRFIYANDSGGISIVVPSDNCGLTLDQIKDSFNVSSITDSGTGHYIVNMSITMANINYAAFADGRFNLSDGDGSANLTLRRIAQTTTSYGIRCSDASANVYNPTFVTGVVFGD